MYPLQPDNYLNHIPDNVNNYYDNHHYYYYHNNNYHHHNNNPCLVNYHHTS